MAKAKKSSTHEPGRFRQTLAALIVNLGSVMYGTTLGWTSPMTPILQSDSTPVGSSGMTDEEASWLTGSLCVGAILTLPIYSRLVEKLGRRRCGLLMAVPIGVSWLLTLIANDPSYLYVARFLAGVGGAGCLYTVPLYVSEIAGDQIRGQLGSFMVFGINIGIVMAYAAGAVMSYSLLAICSFIIPIIFIGAFLFMPETPIYLLRLNRIDDAARSLLWLNNGDKANVDRELIRLQTMVNENAADSKSVGLKDLNRDRGTRKAFILALGLLGGQQMCGIFVMISYAATIFKMAGSELSPNSATIIIGAIQIFGSWLSTVLMERAGRKLLMTISCIGMGLCLLTIGIFSDVQQGRSADDETLNNFRWIPLAALSIYAIVYNVGMASGPYVVSSEIFNTDIRSLANFLAQLFMWLLAFLLVKFFPMMMSNIGVSGSFYFLSVCCFTMFLFIFVLVPETKGRTLQSILDQLNRPDAASDKNYCANLDSHEMTQKNAIP